MSLINDAEKLGNSGRNLILETAGKIYIKVADRFYELNFKDKASSDHKTIINNTVFPEIELPEIPEIDLSNYVTKKYLRSALNNYITVRGWDDVKKTQKMLENALLEGFTESISPITVQTMQLIVGTENLQFAFIKSRLEDEVVPPGFSFEGNNVLKCPDGWIKHYTLDGPEAVKPETNIKYYGRWHVKNQNESVSDHFTYLQLDNDDLSYYVYIRAKQHLINGEKVTDDDVEATGFSAEIEDDLRSSEEAEYIISSEAIPIDHEPGYYYFLCAIVTDKSNGARSIGYMNGFTEILPGQITAYVFKTPEGTQYLDFLGKQFRIGDENAYWEWNTPNSPETLTIKGNLSVIGGNVATSLQRLNGLTGTFWFASQSPSYQTSPRPLLDDLNTNPITWNWPASIWNNIDINYQPTDENWEDSDWSTVLTSYNEVKKAHVGDRYYVDNDENGPDKEKVYEFKKEERTSGGITSDIFYWEEIEEDDGAWRYLVEAIKGRSDIEGGLILSKLLMLGYSTGDPNNLDDYYAKFTVMSGINGVYLPDLGGKTIAAWFGGDLADKENPEGSKFLVTEYGNKCIYQGKLSGTHEYPYQWENENSPGSYIYTNVENPVPGTHQYVGSPDPGSNPSLGTIVKISRFPKSLFRMDGSGYLADGNITWDATTTKIGPLTVGSNFLKYEYYNGNQLKSRFEIKNDGNIDIVGAIKASLPRDVVIDNTTYHPVLYAEGQSLFNGDVLFDGNIRALHGNISLIGSSGNYFLADYPEVSIRGTNTVQVSSTNGINISTGSSGYISLNANTGTSYIKLNGPTSFRTGTTYTLNGNYQFIVLAPTSSQTITVPNAGATTLKNIFYIIKNVGSAGILLKKEHDTDWNYWVTTTSNSVGSFTIASGKTILLFHYSDGDGRWCISEF